MSTIVYQEVSQSSLSLKLSNPSKLIFSSSTTTSHSNNNYDNKHGWSAIEALSCRQKNEPETQYVHPLAKRSSYSKFMSEKSLEMCTESLGSETGVFFPESSLYIPATTATITVTTTATTVATNNSNSNGNNRKPWCPSNKGYEFPPPLTTMRGSNSLQVRPYREDGRLVIKAVSAPSFNSCLKVERSDGRLRLSLVTDDQDDTEEEETEAEAEAETETAVSMECKFGIDIDEEEGGKERKEEREKEKEEEDVAVEGKEFGGVRLGEDMDGITFKFGGKMGTGEQFQRPNNTSCRCKEGGRGNIKRLINWEPFWVAT